MLQQNNTANTVIGNTVNNQRKQNKHLGIKDDFWPVFTATLTISLPVERRYLPPQ